MALQTSSSPRVLSLRVQVLSGAFDVDLYLPAIRGRAPLVIVAHGFWRSKAKMVKWVEASGRAGLCCRRADVALLGQPRSKRAGHPRVDRLD